MGVGHGRIRPHESMLKFRNLYQELQLRRVAKGLGVRIEAQECLI